MKKIVIIQGIVIALLIIAVALLAFGNDKWEAIATGNVDDFTMINADIAKYDNIKVTVTASKTTEAIAPVVLWSGEIPEDAILYKVALSEDNKVYDLMFSIRDDGIGCYPTDYPYDLQLSIYGR